MHTLRLYSDSKLISPMPSPPLRWACITAWGMTPALLCHVTAVLTLHLWQAGWFRRSIHAGLLQRNNSQYLSKLALWKRHVHNAGKPGWITVCIILKDCYWSLTDGFGSPHGVTQVICYSAGETQTGRDSDWPAAVSEDRFALLKKKEQIFPVEFCFWNKNGFGNF